MKKIFTLNLVLVFVVLLFTTQTLKAQDEILWEHTFGGSDAEWCKDIVRTVDGGFIIAGYTESNDGLVTGLHDSSDVWIVKTDSAGNMQWQKSLGGSGNESAEKILQTSDNGYIMIGTTTSNDGDVTSNHGDRDVWVCKIDSAGAIQWSRCIGGSDRDYTKSMCLTPNGVALLVHGWSTDGDFTLNMGSGEDCLLLIVDENNGNTLMTKQFGGSGDDQGFDIKYTSDNNLIIVSWTNSDDLDVSGHIEDYDCWVVKMDTTGVILWSNCFGGSQNDFAQEIVETSDGGFAISGSTKSIDIPGAHDSLYSDYYLAKMDASGNLLWHRAVGGSMNDGTPHLLERSNGSLVLGGESSSDDDYVSDNYGFNDCWIIQFDSLGNVEWEKNFGGTGSESVLALAESNDGQIVFTGFTNSTNMNVNSTYGGSDFWMVKLTDSYNLLTGKIFADINANLIQDSLENELPYIQVSETTSGRNGFSGSNGSYRVSVLDTGVFNIQPAVLNHYTSNPATHSAGFSAFNLVDSLNDFAYQPNGQINDMRITITALTPVRPGRSVAYQIDYKNVGTTTISGDVWLTPSHSLAFDSSSVIPFSIMSDSIQWTYNNIVPFSSGEIIIYFTSDSTLIAGDTVFTTALITPLITDSVQADNYSVSEKIVVTSFDPNDIHVDRDIVFTNELSDPPYLDYTVRFQNTGTDTTFRVNVYVSLSRRLQPGTFEMLASSGVPDVSYLPVDNQLLFHFDNIGLPASSVNESGSHGFVRFRLKPSASLVQGMMIDNFAAIYFDYNAPVITNTASTVIMMPTAVREISSEQVLIYPQPASDFISVINESKQFDSYEIIGMTGNVLIIGNSPDKIDVRNLSSGMYILKLISREKTYSARFIKNNHSR